MKRMISFILCLLFCFSLCACSEKDMDRYADLIEAIEEDDYKEALEELQELMGVQPSVPVSTVPTNQSVPYPSCDHAISEATCTEPGVCLHCGEVFSDALGHQYADGVCTRCGTDDPAEAELLAKYNVFLSMLQNYETYGSVFVGGEIGSLKGNDAVEYLYQRLLELDDYRDCAQYLSRISVVEDQLLYVDLLERDNLGNLRNSTTIDYAYDSQGRVIMSEHIAFNEDLGIYLLDYFGSSLCDHYASGGSQYYTEVRYGEDGRIEEIKCYYVSLRAIMEPTYDDNGRIDAIHYRMNTEEGDLQFSYSDAGQLLRIEGPNYWLAYQYNADGTVHAKTTAGYSSTVSETVYHYDADGRLLGWTQGSCVCVVELDDQGRIYRELVTTTESEISYEYHYGDYYVYQAENSD